MGKKKEVCSLVIGVSSFDGVQISPEHVPSRLCNKPSKIIDELGFEPDEAILVIDVKNGEPVLVKQFVSGDDY